MDNDLCRLCLQKDPFIKVFCDQTAIEKIWNCCNIKVDLYDVLPKHICVMCLDNLNSILDFKKMCQANDKYLREKYSDGNVKLEQEDISPRYKVPIKLEMSNNDCFDHASEPSTDAPETGSDIDNLIERAKSDNLLVNNSKKIVETVCSDIGNNANERIAENDVNILQLCTIQMNNEKSRLLDSEQCSKCRKTFKTSATLKNHIRSAHVDVVSCNICGKLIKKFYIKHHMVNNNEGDKRYQCKVCKIKCNSKSCLEAHGKVHRGVKLKKPIVVLPGDNCPMCGIYLEAKKYDHHLKTHDPQPYVCDMCKRTFKSKSCMKTHIEAHNKIKARQCYMCGKLLKNNDTLQYHIKTHLLSYMVSCKLCGKTVKKSSLKNHMLIHTGEKKFECDICKQKFISKTCVRSHMIIHSGSKPFQCKFCGTKFASAKTLTDHEKLHTGETPHHCPVCNKGFIQISNMKSHFKNNHKGVEYVYKSKIKLKRESMMVLKL